MTPRAASDYYRLISNMKAYEILAEAKEKKLLEQDKYKDLYDKIYACKGVIAQLKTQLAAQRGALEMWKIYNFPDKKAQVENKIRELEEDIAAKKDMIAYHIAPVRESLLQPCREVLAQAKKEELQRESSGPAPVILAKKQTVIEQPKPTFAKMHAAIKMPRAGRVDADLANVKSLFSSLKRVSKGKVLDSSRLFDILNWAYKAFDTADINGREDLSHEAAIKDYREEAFKFCQDYAKKLPLKDKGTFWKIAEKQPVFKDFRTGWGRMFKRNTATVDKIRAEILNASNEDAEMQNISQKAKS